MEQDVVAIPATALGGAAFLTAFSATPSAPLSHVPLRFGALLLRPAREISGNLANAGQVAASARARLQAMWTWTDTWTRWRRS